MEVKVKILICFIDMLRGKEKISSNKNFEKILKDIGGSYYNNAYAVSSDTYRSFASIITGLYPINNGCTNSNYIPNIFLKEKNNIFSYLLKKNFNIYLKIRPHFSNIGMFPEIEKMICSNDIEKLALEYQKDESENKLFFYYDEDYHQLLTKESSKNQEKKARGQVAKNLEFLLKNINEKEFDKILIFSDHGCTLYEDEVKDFYNIEDNRNKIIILIKNNKDEKFKEINKLVSTLDIFPTIISWFENEKKYKLDGIKLIEEHENELYIEDGYCDYLGYFLNFKKIKKYYKIRIIKNNLDNTYDYNDVIKEENLSMFKEVSKKLVYCNIILNLYYIHKRFKIEIEEDLKNFLINKEFYNTNEEIIRYNNYDSILKKDFYNKRTPIFGIKWKILILKLKIKKYIEERNKK